MCHSAFTQGKSKRFNTILAWSLTGLAVFVTLYYHYLQEPKFHQAVFTIMIIVVLFRSFYVMETNLRPRWRSDKKEGEAVNRREYVRDEDIVLQMWSMIRVGLTFYLGASALWALDENYCHYLIRWRRQVGLPWGTLLELHGWWYAFSSFSERRLTVLTQGEGISAPELVRTSTSRGASGSAIV
jgi:dihydroceramidase